MDSSKQVALGVAAGFVAGAMFAGAAMAATSVVGSLVSHGRVASAHGAQYGDFGPGAGPMGGYGQGSAQADPRGGVCPGQGAPEGY